MLQATALTRRRIARRRPARRCCSRSWSSNEDYRFITAEQLRQAGRGAGGASCWSPSGRNTAPALTLAALVALQAATTRCWW